MATFLDLVNSARVECGVSRGTTDDLTTLVGVSGELLRIKGWVNQSWKDIQRKHSNWEFLRASFTFPTVASQQAYTAAQAGAMNWGKWIPTTFRCRVTSLGYTTELFLGEWGWEDFRNLYQFGAQRTVVGRPVVFSISPNKSINLGPLPNATGYTVTGDYFTRALDLSANTDVPTLPDQFVEIIVHKTKIYYGQSEGASEVFDAGTADYKRMMSELELDQLPDIDLGGPML